MAGVPFLSLSALPFPCPLIFISTPVLQTCKIVMLLHRPSVSGPLTIL